ncbi:hypothetical protein H8356DRAFT_1340652 [Neocallimastix lanati (nom. inval.)]|nr:hypothetical protein H8356DRAFT_1340652 [Neocallimastix sp. JGI-2020a]
MFHLQKYIIRFQNRENLLTLAIKCFFINFTILKCSDLSSPSLFGYLNRFKYYKIMNYKNALQADDLISVLYNNNKAFDLKIIFNMRYGMEEFIEEDENLRQQKRKKKILKIIEEFQLNHGEDVNSTTIMYKILRETAHTGYPSPNIAIQCIPNVPTYISNDHEHQNGIINSSLVGVIIGDWKYYNHQGLCFNSKRSIRVGIENLNPMIWCHAEDSDPALYSNLYRPNRLDQHGERNME